MPVQEVRGQKVWQVRNQTQALLSWVLWLLGTAVVLYCWQVIAGLTRWEFVADAPEQAGIFLRRMFPPNWSYMERLWQPLWDTLNIATLGTLISLVIAVPVAFLAARNTSPHPVVRYVALLVIVTSRSVNSLIWALILVAIIGPGLLAGVLAIALRSVGFVSKLLYEAIEEIDEEPVEAIKSTGASGQQVLTYAIVPQVLPAFTGISVFRWDINIRESTVLGLVGAGGIGIQLQGSIDTLRWSQVSVILICIFVMVFISEWLSARVRQSMI